MTGQEEEEHPSCPRPQRNRAHDRRSGRRHACSRRTPGKIYLAGPYNGAPLSIVSITSAKVGPFDLGTVVIRFALDINPTTAQVEVSGAQSEPIPHIIEGIVVHVRDIRVYMNREKFIINPTNCSPMTITETIDGAGADPANPADQDPVDRQHAVRGRGLLEPRVQTRSFKVSTSAKTSRPNGASLTAKLTVPGALGTQANISKVKVELPKAAPLAADDTAESVHRRAVRNQPRGVPAGVDHRAREGDHADPPRPAGRPRVLRQPRRRSVPRA